MPLGGAIVAYVTRVAQPVGLLGGLARERVVADHDAVTRNARHLAHRRQHIREMVRGDTAGDSVEARVGEREMVGRRDHIGLHARRRVNGDHLRPGLSQPPRDVASAGGDVQNGRVRPGVDAEQLGAIAHQVGVRTRPRVHGGIRCHDDGAARHCGLPVSAR